MKRWYGVATMVSLLAVAGCSDDADSVQQDAATSAVQDGGSGSLADGGAATLAEDLAFLREEEKLARDVYLTLYKKWGVNLFKNIAASEQTHTDQVAALLKARGFADPVKDDTVGVFTNSVLLKLYGDLVKQGEASQAAALQVGATIEDLDIHDIAEMAKRTSDSEVLKVYDALSCGSGNHLRSFYAQIKAQGATYTAQYISAAELSSILAGSGQVCGAL